MLQTGFRAMMGVKIFGDDQRKIEELGFQIEQILKQVPGATDVVADRIVGKPYVEFRIDRQKLARYGVNVRDVQDVIELAHWRRQSHLGRWKAASATRFASATRANCATTSRTWSGSSCRPPTARRFPSSEVADIEYTLGPQEIKSEEHAAGRLRDSQHARPRRSERGRGRGRADSGEDRQRRTQVSAEILLLNGRASSRTRSGR